MTNFLRQALAEAQAATRRGAPIHPAAAAAHAANESGYGRSGLSTGANNLFGIKATSGWTGEVVSLPTWEVIDGQRVDTVANFRKYDSWTDCFTDYGGIIGRIYPNAVSGKRNGTMFLAGLFLTGPYKWATDPEAFDKACRIMGLHGDVLFEANETIDSEDLRLRGLTLGDKLTVLFEGHTSALLRGKFDVAVADRTLVVSRE